MLSAGCSRTYPMLVRRFIVECVLSAVMDMCTVLVKNKVLQQVLGTCGDYRKSDDSM